jgi:divalent metal cation (Fe/Co/Zn/Cd) transporter
MDPSVPEELDRRYRTAISFEVAVLLIVLGLTAASWFVVIPTAAADADLTAVWVLILFVAAGSFVLRRALTRWERLRDTKLLRGNSGVLRALQWNTVVLSLLALFVAFAGLAAVLFGGDRVDMLRAAVVAIIVLAINFPRRTIWRRIVIALDEV